jgi:AcrR family transcriptional regulator
MEGRFQMSTPAVAKDSRRRADAVRNRQLVLDAAKVLLAEANTAITVEDIAQRAGVGAGTVVRSFGSKDALLDAAVADMLGPFVERARGTVSDTDTAGVLRRFLTDLIAFQAAHRLVGDQLRGAAQPLTTQCRADLNAVALEMIERGRRDGVVRTDIDATVTLVMLSEMTHAVYRAPGYSGELADAAVTVLMDGLRPPTPRA